VLATDELPTRTTEDGDHRVRSVAQVPAFSRDRHYLHVIGPNAPAIVGCVGGWLFDRAMAGWEVTVFVRDFHNAWPLRILGVRADDYGSALASIEHCPGHRGLAVAAEVYDDDASIRGLVCEALRGRTCEVTIWCDVRPTGLAAQLPIASHRLGPAAGAFKKHALAAATVIPAAKAEGPEVFYSNSVTQRERAIVHASPRSMTSAGRGRVLR
jgi:hypothetical protein